MRRIAAICSSNRLPRAFIWASAATKSSGREPTPSPSTNRPPEIESMLATCFAMIAALRSGAMSTVGISRTRLVTAAAAAIAISTSWLP